MDIRTIAKDIRNDLDVLKEIAEDAIEVFKFEYPEAYFQYVSADAPQGSTRPRWVDEALERNAASNWPDDALVASEEAVHQYASGDWEDLYWGMVSQEVVKAAGLSECDPEEKWDLLERELVRAGCPEGLA